MIPASVIELHYHPMTLTAAGILQILYVGIVTTDIAHICWNKGLQHLPAANCSVFYPLQPLSSAVLGIFILHAPITKGFLIGTLVISAGILLSLIRVPFWPFRASPRGKRR